MESNKKIDREEVHHLVQEDNKESEAKGDHVNDGRENYQHGWSTQKGGQEVIGKPYTTNLISVGGKRIINNFLDTTKRLSDILKRK